MQPRAGGALLREHIQLLSDLSPYCDVLPTVDAYTRHNRYEELRGIAAAGTSACLTAFLLSIMGLDGCERLIDSLSKPVGTCMALPDARLMARSALAAELSSFEGGGGYPYNIPYAKKCRCAQSIRHSQYCDRLVGTI